MIDDTARLMFGWYLKQISKKQFNTFDEAQHLMHVNADCINGATTLTGDAKANATHQSTAVLFCK